MSDLLIKGIGMPRPGKPIVLQASASSEGKLFISAIGDLTFTENEAFEIPPHGRLGDLDELEKRIKEEGRNQAEFFATRYHPVILAYGDCLGKCQSTPTIIPESEERT